MYLYRIGISGKMDHQEAQRGHFVLTLFSHNISEAARILCSVAGGVMYPVSDATISRGILEKTSLACRYGDALSVGT